jgi:hypothetical protein
VWIAGDCGIALRWNGTAWTAATHPFDGLGVAGLWGSGPDDVWAVSTMGPGVGFPDTSHWTGGDWAIDWDSPGGFRVMSGIRGTGPDDVWAVGNGGTVRHYDGTAWTLVR